MSLEDVDLPKKLWLSDARDLLCEPLPSAATPRLQSQGLSHPSLLVSRSRLDLAFRGHHRRNVPGGLACDPTFPGHPRGDAALRIRSLAIAEAFQCRGPARLGCVSPLFTSGAKSHQRSGQCAQSFGQQVQ